MTSTSSGHFRFTLRFITNLRFTAGDIIIELLNWVKDKNHNKTQQFIFSIFLPLLSQYHSNKETEYLQDDC